jgi:GT2 family glycosyltransferase
VLEEKHNTSVIICAYARERLTDLMAAIASIRGQTLAPREIMVVVDHNPQLLQLVRMQEPEVIVVENTGARGLSGARNSGVAAAKGQILAFLDDDAIADPDWLMHLHAGFRDTNVLGVGGAVQPIWLAGHPPWLPEEFYWVVGCTYKGMPAMAAPIRNPIGASMSFRREVFEKAGGFRADVGRLGTLPVGCEETEWCIRAAQRWPNGVFLYQPRARVSHRVPSERTRWRYFCARCYAEGLSKARVARYVGTRDGLSSERSYILRTLPRGMMRNLAVALLHREVAALARAGAIAAGLTLTTAGYVAGNISLLFARTTACIPYRRKAIYHVRAS